MKAAPTNEDRHLESVRDVQFPNSEGRRWPATGGAGWFKAPRALPVLLQILTDKDVVIRGDPGAAYLELLSRVREPGFLILEHPAEHARLVGYARERTWREAMQQLSDLGFIEIKSSQGREFAYVLVVNPFIAVRRLHKKGKVRNELWNLFYEKWTKARAQVPDEETVGDDASKEVLTTPALPQNPPRRARRTRAK
jgi:hypothetical protein